MFLERHLRPLPLTRLERFTMGDLRKSWQNIHPCLQGVSRSLTDLKPRLINEGPAAIVLARELDDSVRNR